MENIDFATLFQGIGTMMASGWVLASARVFLALLGLLLIYLGSVSYTHLTLPTNSLV